MSKQTYHPARGDILYVNFAPSAGTEFTGPPYGLVISSLAFSKSTGLSIVLPLTTKHHADKKLHGSQLMVQMPPLAGMNEQGWVYLHHIKTIDYRERGAAFKTRIGDDDLDFLIDVMDRVRALIDPDSLN